MRLFADGQGTDAADGVRDFRPHGAEIAGRGGDENARHRGGDASGGRVLFHPAREDAGARGDLSSAQAGAELLLGSGARWWQKKRARFTCLDSPCAPR